MVTVVPDSFYFPYCFKILISERSPKEDKARGVLDRGFKINSYKGFPQFKIKEIRNPQGNTLRQKLLNDIMDFRKILLIYKLIHSKDSLVEIEIGIDGRDEELCKPLLQLFATLGASAKIQSEIELTLQHFLNIKNQRKQNSREAIIYPMVASGISKYGLRMDTGLIWQEITTSLEGQLDEKDDKIFRSSDYGDFYRSTIIGIITDKFGAELEHKKKGNLIVFNPDIFERMGKQYDNSKGIRTRVLNGDSIDSGDLCPEPHLLNEPVKLDSINEKNVLSSQYKSLQSLASPRISEYPPDCYYCDETFNEIGKQEYEKHVLSRHPKKQCYPGLSDIKKLSLTPKGMPWEI